MATTIVTAIRVVLVLLLCVPAAAQPFDSSNRPAPSPPQSSSESEETHSGEEQRQREGSQLSGEVGHFRSVGDRLVLQVHDSPNKYVCLENLALERIGKAINQRGARGNELLWDVTGTFTEYRGVNYLLVTRAVLRRTAASNPTNRVERREGR